ncbi:hypothetical protein C2E23DRAFT_815122 [Lenzites betulinus]|nr:hypothetical protein C2E23DRAFT_815122 [Lenzites betulinus]
MFLLDLSDEILEHILQFVKENRFSLADCSATCHRLLTLCRPALWNTITLPYGIDGTPLLETTEFLHIVRASPAIAFSVRSATVKAIVRPELDRRALPSESEWDRFAVVTREVYALLQNLRTLRLQEVYAASLLSLVLLAADLPRLETLILDRVVVASMFRPGDEMTLEEQPNSTTELSIPVNVQQQQWSLKRLVITEEPVASSTTRYSTWSLKKLWRFENGGSTRSDFVALGRFLKQSAEFLSLQSLEILSLYAPTLLLPLLHADTTIPSLGSSLRHLEFAIADALYNEDVSIEGRNEIIDLFAVLQSCPQLRSLSIHYYPEHMLPTPTKWWPSPVHPFFLNALADTLAGSPSSSTTESCTAPLPHLQCLTIIFRASVDCVLDCADAFERLASVLVGSEGESAALGRQRYQAFSTLATSAIVRTPVASMWLVDYDSAFRKCAKGRMLLRQMLARFEEAGVHVDIRIEHIEGLL